MQAPGGREGFDNLSATRGPGMNHANTPNSDQIYTITTRMTGPAPFINRL